MCKVNIRFRLSNVIALLVGALLVGLGGHYWITDRSGVLRLLYPVQALAADWSIRCSISSPIWMREVMRRAVHDNYALSNQLAYVDGSGRVHHCESGWRGGMFFSPRLTAADRFRYASTSKLFTTDAILRQVGAGRLSLNDRLLDRLPEVSSLTDERITRITIEQLLRHQGGFDRMRSPDPMFLHGQRPWCPYELDSLSRLRLDFSPGERHVYSNLGYCLLGLVLERSTGAPYREWMEHEYGLEARGIRFVDGGYLSDEVRYDFRNSAIYGENYSRHFDFYANSATAGFSGSAVALAGVVREMLNREGASLVSAALPTQCDATQLRACYGYGAYVLKRPGEAFHIFVQPGLLYGVTTLAIVDSEGGVLVWFGNGVPRSGMAADDMTLYLLGVLSDFYKQG